MKYSSQVLSNSFFFASCFSNTFVSMTKVTFLGIAPSWLAGNLRVSVVGIVGHPAPRNSILGQMVKPTSIE